MFTEEPDKSCVGYIDNSGIMTLPIQPRSSFSITKDFVPFRNTVKDRNWVFVAMITMVRFVSGYHDNSNYLFVATMATVTICL